MDKSVDGALGTRTRGGNMEGADASTELCRYPFSRSWTGLKYCNRKVDITTIS